MFDNIGSKIKTLAKVLCWIGIIVSIILAIIMFISIEDARYSEEGLYRGLGFGFLFIGPLLSWISSFLLYGFGQLVENSDTIVQQAQTHSTKKSENFDNTPNSKQDNADSAESPHKWRCDSCGETISSNPCPYCGK